MSSMSCSALFWTRVSGWLMLPGPVCSANPFFQEAVFSSHPLATSSHIKTRILDQPKIPSLHRKKIEKQHKTNPFKWDQSEAATNFGWHLRSRHVRPRIGSCLNSSKNWISNINLYIYILLLYIYIYKYINNFSKDMAFHGREKIQKGTQHMEIDNLRPPGNMSWAK